MTLRINTALFVPATHTDRIVKAYRVRPDIVIVDLEDAVATSQKRQVRDDLSCYLSQHTQHKIWLRINDSINLPQAYQDDIKLVQQHDNIKGILLPKVETGEQITQLYHAINKPIVAMIESAEGLLALPTIAAATGLVALTYGILDFANDLGFEASSQHAQDYLKFIRFQLLLHSRANNLLPPIDSIYPNFSDKLGFSQHILPLQDQGMGGMLCIHPVQVAPIQALYQPTPAQLAWAKAVIAEHLRLGSFAFSLDGEMVDKPVIEKAKRIVSFG